MNQNGLVFWIRIFWFLLDSDFLSFYWIRIFGFLWIWIFGFSASFVLPSVASDTGSIDIAYQSTSDTKVMCYNNMCNGGFALFISYGNYLFDGKLAHITRRDIRVNETYFY
jgi:hypothetical protein